MAHTSGLAQLGIAHGQEAIGMCLKGKSTAKAKPGNFICKRCGAVSAKKGKLCDPKKIKDK